MKFFKQHVSVSLAFILAIMMCFAVALPNKAYADDTELVTIGTGEGETPDLPYFNRWGNSRTQIIYRSAEIGRDGAITTLAYNVAVATADFNVKSLKIWMGYTDLDKYEYDKTGRVKDSEYSLDESDLTLVYEGNPDIGTNTGWETIELDNAFDYERKNGNLVIVTGIKTGGDGAKDLKYYYTRNDDCTDDTDYSDITSLIRGSNNPTIAEPGNFTDTDYWVIRSARPNIQLGFSSSEGGQTDTCEISFDADGGSPEPTIQIVDKGGYVQKPEDPIRDGYKFTGWYKGDKIYNFETRVTSSFALKAGWVKLHNIKFIGWNDQILQEFLIEDGQIPEYTGATPERPDADEKTYIFAGWDHAIEEVYQDEVYKAVFIDKAELADKTELEKAVAAATDARTGVKSSDDGSDVGVNFKYVTESEWQTYDAALVSAQRVANNPYAKQAEVDQEVIKLQDAFTAFENAKKNGKKILPNIEKIVISNASGRQQPASGGTFEWKITFPQGTDLTKISDDDFQIQRKPYGKDWKNSKCPYASFAQSESEDEKNVAYLTGMAIPDNVKVGDTTNLWRFIYAGGDIECPVITQEGYSYVDKSALNTLISDAESAVSDIKTSIDGYDIDPSEQYVTPEEMNAIDNAIAAAKEVVANSKATQGQVDSATDNLSIALDSFIAAKKAGRWQEETGGFLPGDYRLIYETEKVTLADIPVREVKGNPDGGSTEWFNDKAIRFEFYNSTTQSLEGIYTTKAGQYTDDEGVVHDAQILSDVKLTRGHVYMVSVHEKDYMIPTYYDVLIDDGKGNTDSYRANMANYYISLSENGKLPTNVKTENKIQLKHIDISKRNSELSDESDNKRINVTLPVYYTQDGTAKTILSGVEDAVIKFTSPQETLYATSNRYGQVSVALVEDIDYMVSLLDDSGALALQSFPLTVKDHAENGWPKSIYNHFSCGSVQGLYLVDKSVEHQKDTTLVSSSKKTSVTGLNFQNDLPTDMDHYFINDRQLDNNSVSGLDGKDYEVFIVEAINMYRTELSKLASGVFRITRNVPEGKNVDRVYYKNKKGVLKSIRFTESNGKVEYEMKSLSMYPNVIVYRSASSSAGSSATPSSTAPTSSAGTVTINTSTVTAESVKAAISVARGHNTTTTIVLDKNVKKISKGALKGTNVKTIVVKSKKLKKKTVKGSLKGSKVKTIKVKVGSKKTNKKYVKKYKKIFTKKNAGKKVKVER